MIVVSEVLHEYMRLIMIMFSLERVRVTNSVRERERERASHIDRLFVA